MKNECEMMDNPQKCKKAISLTIPLEKTKIQTKTKQKKTPKPNPKYLEINFLRVKIYILETGFLLIFYLK